MFIGCSDLLRLQKSQRKIWPLPFTFEYFHFSLSTFMTVKACCLLLIIMLPAGSRSALWLIDPY